VRVPVIMMAVTLQTPPDWDAVGWFSPGFRPGAPGHAVLNGHLDTTLADTHRGVLEPQEASDL
jgi:hypothetical protein